MSEPFPAPRPITAEERQYIADVENSLRPAFLHAVAEEFGPADRPAAEIAEQMSAAAPGHRLQTAVEARMNSLTHFDALPAEERSAAAQQAALVTAQAVSQLSVRTADGRLGDLAGRGADRVLRGQYEKLAQDAAGRAGMVLGGAINRARFLQVEEIRRQAGAGMTPPSPRTGTGTGTGTEVRSESGDGAAARPADRARSTRGHGRG